MSKNHESNMPLLSRLMLIPAVVGLLSVSVIVGYASNDLWAKHPRYSLQVARLDAQDTTTSEDATHTNDADSSDDPVANYKTTLDLLKQHYYGATIDSAKTRQLTYDAIRGMLDSLRDQFTSFMDPDQWAQMQIQTRGDFEGIGAYLEPDGVNVKIARPIENSPAEKAGLKANDVIVSVDGVSVKGKDINDVVRRIKGQRGTKVLIGIMRGKELMSFRITRARVEPPIVQHWMEDKQAKIGHIVLSEFNEKSIEQMDQAYEDLERQGMRALVFDLRYDPGGLLEVAIDVASVFIPRDTNKDLNNVVVYIREGSGHEQARKLHDVEHIYKRVPMVVLVNDNSASASEIVSGAIKDYGVATIMGQRTFGKGRVQTLYPLDDGSALRLTTALYYTPAHRDINFKRDEDGNRIPGTGGIVPDVEVKQSPKWKMEDFKDKVDDTQLQKALEFLRDRLNGMTTAQATQQVLKTR